MSESPLCRRSLRAKEPASDTKPPETLSGPPRRNSEPPLKPATKTLQAICSRASMPLSTKPSRQAQCTRTRRTERNPASANSLQKRLWSKSSPNNFSGFQFYLNKRRMGNLLIRLCFIKTKRKYSEKCRFRD